MFLQFDLVAAGLHVDLAGLQADLPGFTVFLPAYALAGHPHANIARYVDQVGPVLVDGITLGLNLDLLSQQFTHLAEGCRVLAGPAVNTIFFRVAAAGKGQRATGMLLLGHAAQVGGEPDLRFDLFFAVTVVVVRDHGHHHARGISRRDLEGIATVVSLLLILPAHSLVDLLLRCFRAVGQAQLLLGQGYQVGCQNHATGMTGPVLGVQRGVVFRQHRVTAVAEDAFDEIEVADQVAGGEETDLHIFDRTAAGHLGHNHGAQQQGDE